MAIIRRSRQDNQSALGGESSSPSSTSTMMNSDDINKISRGLQKTNLIRGGIGLIILLAVYSLYGIEREEEISTSSLRTANDNHNHNSNINPEIIVPDLSNYNPNCTISFQPQVESDQSKWPKPLWMPSYPGSGAASPAKQGDILKPFVDGITGLRAGSKNYHMSSKQLKRCKGPTETAVCTQGHPIVPIGPEKQIKNFHPNVLYVIRNFHTVFPASFNDKAIAYHNVKGQIPEDSWRQARDNWGLKSFDSWKNMILTWKQMDDYNISLYIPYEYLLDPMKGPTILEQISKEFSNAGFTNIMTTTDDIKCLWYQIISKEYKRRTTFYQYTPGWTIEQRDWLLKNLTTFADEVKDDQSLVDILNFYIQNIHDTLRIDHVWVNTTETKND